jgi:hypothetical protein
VWWAFGLAVGLLVVGVLAIYVWPRWRVQQELREWAKTGLSLTEYQERFHRPASSEEARELARLACPLGLALDRTTRKTCSAKDKKPLRALDKYMRGIVEADASRALSPLPLEARRFLEGHRAAIEAIEGHLSLAEDLSWEMNVNAGIAAEGPGLLHLRTLHQVLLLEALERVRRSDSGGAERLVSAAQRLAASLGDRPDTLSQIAAAGVALQQYGVLRMEPALGSGRSGELTDARFLEAFPRSLRAEAFAALIWVRGRASSARQSEVWGSRRKRALWVGSAEDAWGARLSAHLRRARVVAQVDDPCTLDMATIRRELGEQVKWEKVVGLRFAGLLALPSPERTWAVACAADLEGERTRLVLEAYHRRRSSGDWGETTAVRSRVCPSLEWMRRREPDGRLTIAPDAVPLPELQRPWEFTLGIPEGGR